MPSAEKSVRNWEKNLPFPKGFLSDRMFFGEDWDWVLFLKDRALMQKQGGRRLLWAEILMDQVVSLNLVPTSETVETFNRYGWDLHPRDVEKINKTLHIGSPYTACHKALFPGNFRRYWIEYPPQPLPNGSVRHRTRIDTLEPSRRAILQADVDSQGNLLQWALLQGSEGLALEAQLGTV